MSITKSVRVVNEAGLHARPCHAIVSTAIAYPCSLRIRRAGEGSAGVNGKSILELMTLEARLGVDLELTADGDEAEALLAELEGLFASGFGEQAPSS
ncbi:MAG: HPr family phosphocarrier protein [Planctomycetota bacterium]|jgi:phosphocarrier protein